jgi:hypothetical protein
MNKPPRPRAIAAVFLPTPCQLSPDHADGAAKKPTERLLAIASILLGKHHAISLAAEVPTSVSIEASYALGDPAVALES